MILLYSCSRSAGIAIFISSSFFLGLEYMVDRIASDKMSFFRKGIVKRNHRKGERGERTVDEYLLVLDGGASRNISRAAPGVRGGEVQVEGLTAIPATERRVATDNPDLEQLSSD